jgi:hypothetical protein
MSFVDLLLLIEFTISVMKNSEMLRLPQQRWTIILCKLSLFGYAFISRSFVKQDGVIKGNSSSVIGIGGVIKCKRFFCVDSGDTCSNAVMP